MRIVPVHLRIDRVQHVAMGGETTLIRVFGAWSAPEQTAITGIELDASGERFAPLPDPTAPEAFATPDGEPWRTAFAVPARLATCILLLLTAESPPVRLDVESPTTQMLRAELAAVWKTATAGAGELEALRAVAEAQRAINASLAEVAERDVQAAAAGAAAACAERDTATAALAGARLELSAIRTELAASEDQAAFERRRADAAEHHRSESAWSAQATLERAETAERHLAGARARMEQLEQDSAARSAEAAGLVVMLTELTETLIDAGHRLDALSMERQDLLDHIDSRASEYEDVLAALERQLEET